MACLPSLISALLVLVPPPNGGYGRAWCGVVGHQVIVGGVPAPFIVVSTLPDQPRVAVVGIPRFFGVIDANEVAGILGGLGWGLCGRALAGAMLDICGRGRIREGDRSQVELGVHGHGSLGLVFHAGVGWQVYSIVAYVGGQGSKRLLPQGQMLMVRQISFKGIDGQQLGTLVCQYLFR
jgi:hypothetical protein